MPSAPYDSLETVLSTLRVAVNDAIVSIGGQTITDSAAFTPFYVNRGWQMLQQELLSLRFVRLKVLSFPILGLPASSNLDTQYQSTLSWSGFSDGLVTDATKFLPQTLIKPLKISERVSGQAPNTGLFLKMSGPDEGISGIPNIPKDYRNRIWSWANDAIQFPGTTGPVDISMDFASYLPDFTGSGAGFPGTQVVPILRSTDAFAWFIAFGFSQARNDDPAVCSFTLGEARRAAAILAGSNPPSQTVQAVQ